MLKGDFMKLNSFIVKNNRIVGARLENDGKLMDTYLDNIKNISELDLMNLSYLRGIRAYPDDVVSVEELMSGKRVATFDEEINIDDINVVISRPRTHIPVTLDFEREVELDMFYWLYNRKDTMLYVSGARQTGKTYAINKFIDKVWGSSAKVYRLNLADADVKAKLDEFYHRPFEKVKYGYKVVTTLERFAEFYFDDFNIDTADVLFIDEVQEDAGIYNTMREFAREEKCRLIVSGSYLNIVSQAKLANNKFKVQAGGTYEIEMTSLSFLEFLQANGIINSQVLFKSSDYYTEEDNKLFEEVQKLYKVYLKIGGYPSVVKEYIRTKSVESAQDILQTLVENYFFESKPYLELCSPMIEFEEAFKALLSVLTDTNKRFKVNDISEEINKIIKRKRGSITVNDIVTTLNWLTSGGFLGRMQKYCDLKDLNDYATSQRYYFKDLGVVNYVNSFVNLPESTLNGYLAENFAYLQIYDGIRFSTSKQLIKVIGYYYKNSKDEHAELDFIYKDSNKGNNYVAVEVKYNNTSAKTLKMIRDSKSIKYTIKAINAKTDITTGSIPIFMLRFFYMLSDWKY